MELEQRVQALEQEVEVLKNQIKATLLDIQEQILTNAYPSLRAENSALPRSSAQPIPQAIAQTIAQPTVAVRPQVSDDEPIVLPKSAPVKRVTLEEIDPDQAEENAEPEIPKVVAVRPVNLNKAPNGTPPNKTPPSQQIAEELTAWANRQVKEIGPVGTAELIRSYAEQGKITPDAADALLNSITQNNPEPSRMGENGAHRQGPVTSVSANGQNGNGHGPNGLKSMNGKGQPSVQKVQSAPDQTAAQTPPFEPPLNQFEKPSKPAQKRRRPHFPAVEAGTMDVLPTNDQRVHSQTPAQPAAPQIRMPRNGEHDAPRRFVSPVAKEISHTDVQPAEAQPPAPQPQMLHVEEVEAPRKLVLKLIAGVQNAGAGIGGRKKNQNG